MKISNKTSHISVNWHNSVNIRIFDTKAFLIAHITAKILPYLNMFQKYHINLDIGMFYMSDKLLQNVVHVSILDHTS